jgi:hypothetical protein
MRFNPDLLELVPKEQLDTDFGGDYEFEFEPESYWQQIVSYVNLLPLIDFSKPLCWLRIVDTAGSRQMALEYRKMKETPHSLQRRKRHMKYLQRRMRSQVAC